MGSPTMPTEAVLKIGGLRLTRRRLAWLRHLERERIARRWRSNVGFEVMAAGLTTWAWRDEETGEILDEKEKRARFSGNGKWPIPDGEMLTELGRWALAEVDRLEAGQ